MGKLCELYLCGQKLILHPERALFWWDKKLLIVADAHFGKAQVFREEGIAVPAGTTAGDLERLFGLMDQFAPRQLIFLGDLIHGRLDNPLKINGLVKRWRRRYMDVRISLVTGNHDRFGGLTPPHWQFERVAEDLLIEPFQFTHKPKTHSAHYTIAGHIHPAVTLRGMARQKETLPCFYFGAEIGILPAFGSFTGNHVIHPAPEDRIFVVADQRVIKMAHGRPSDPA